MRYASQLSEREKMQIAELSPFSTLRHVPEQHVAAVAVIYGHRMPKWGKPNWTVAADAEQVAYWRRAVLSSDIAALAHLDARDGTWKVQLTSAPMSH